MSVLSWAQWLQATPTRAAIRESLWFPIIETVHVLGIAFVLGTVGILDLRLLGFGMRRQPVSQVAEQLIAIDLVKPLRNKLAGALSMALWFGVGLAGRGIGFL